jgi:hypothetical protein
MSVSLVGFEVLTAVRTKMAAFWVVAPCSLVEVHQRFRGPCCLHHQGDRPTTQKTAIFVGQLLRDYSVQYTRRLSSSIHLQYSCVINMHIQFLNSSSGTGSNGTHLVAWMSSLRRYDSDGSVCWRLRYSATCRAGNSVSHTYPKSLAR